MSKHEYIYNDNPDCEPNFIGITSIADEAMAAKVIAAPVDDLEGRSPWLWVRLANGDLLLATYPRGDMYFETELDHNRP